MNAQVSKSVFPDETPNFTERLSASTAAKKAREAAEAAEPGAILAARRAGRKKKKRLRGGDRRPSFGKTRASRRATQRMRRIDCASMLCFGPPDPPFHPAWQRAVGIPPGLQQNARCIDSDGVAPLVEALDRDCSLAGFDGGAMHFGSLTFVFSDLAHDPCPKRRPGKNGRRFYQWRPCAAVVFGCAPSMQPRDR